MEEKYTGEFKIKNQIGVNLLETYEVNGKQYIDNIPNDFLIGIPKEQYIRYKQQEEELENLCKIEKEHQKLNGELRKEIERLKNIVNEFDKWLLGEQMMFYKGSDGETLIRYGETRNKWLELKGSDK